MTTPVKDLSYLSGAYPLAAHLLPPRPLVLAPRGVVAMRLMPPFWKSLSFASAQPTVRTMLIPRPLYLRAMTQLKITLFWRASSGMPLKGQRWPLTR